MDLLKKKKIRASVVSHHLARSKTQLQRSCLVCHKRFLLTENQLSHIKSYREGEDKGACIPASSAARPSFYNNERLTTENVHHYEKLFE